MALTTFGPSLDLHVGGMDLQFPHHAYEASMVETVYGVHPFARAWLHVGTVQVAGEKMARVGRKPRPRVRRGGGAVPGRGAAPVADRPSLGPAVGLRARALRARRGTARRLYAAAARGTDEMSAATRAVTVALAADLDVPAALAVAESDGGAAARLTLSVLGLARDRTAPLVAGKPRSSQPGCMNVAFLQRRRGPLRRPWGGRARRPRPVVRRRGT